MPLERKLWEDERLNELLELRPGLDHGVEALFGGSELVHVFAHDSETICALGGQLEGLIGGDGLVDVEFLVEEQKNLAEIREARKTAGRRRDDVDERISVALEVVGVRLARA